MKKNEIKIAQIHAYLTLCKLLYMKIVNKKGLKIAIEQ